MVNANIKRTAICLASLQFTFISVPALSASVSETQPRKMLQGRVSTETEKAANPGLSRSDLGDQLVEPLSGDDQPTEEIDAPTRKQMMMEPVRVPDHPPVPKQPLRGSIDGWDRGKFTSMQPLAAPFGGAGEPMPNFQQPTFQQPQPPQNPVQQNDNDPDNSPEMLLLWDIWHHHVAEAIYQRFNFLAKLGFQHSPPLLCQVSYIVTRDGHIQNIQVQQKSPNLLFNMIVYQCVNSLNGDMSLLAFPQGSRRRFVPKIGTFTQNYGCDGFKYTTGDRETLSKF